MIRRLVSVPRAVARGAGCFLRRAAVPGTFAFALAAPLSAAPAPPVDLEAFAAARAQLRAGVDSGRVETLLSARAVFERLAAEAPGRRELPYWVALADWRAAGMLMMRKEHAALARATCEHGLAAADEALRLSPDWGEALALRAGLLGVSLSFRDPADMMTVGPELIALHARARRQAPASPRVLLLDGMSTLNMPAFAGGGPAPALALLRAAMAAADTERVADPLAPDWGADDARVWAGRAALLAGDPAEAKRRFEQALERNPSNGWVRTRLLPEAERALADSAGRKPAGTSGQAPPDTAGKTP
jgi:tetratricopeptide (TPR) repeat protein